MSKPYPENYPYSKSLRSRKKLRLKDHDYSDPGIYFITICTWDKMPLLSRIINYEPHLSPAGIIIQSTWDSLPTRYPGLEIDQFVIMPNHLHGIIILADDLRYSRPAKKLKPTISDIIDAWKGAATYRIRRETRFTHFEWQKSFNDVIVRNERILNRIRRYIVKNPERWMADRFYTKDDGMYW